MNIALHLEQLKIKRAPGQEVKSGILVKFKSDKVGGPVEATTGKDKDKHEDVNKDEDDDEDEEKGDEAAQERGAKRHHTKIQDARGKRPIDRALILNRIHHKKAKIGLNAVPILETGDISTKIAVQEETDEPEDGKAVNEIDEDSLFRLNTKSVSDVQIPKSDIITFKRKKPKAAAAKEKGDVLDDVLVEAPKKGKKGKKEGVAVEAEADVLVEAPKKDKKAKRFIIENRPEWRDLMKLKIGSDKVGDRLPREVTDREKIIVKASHYYMNNRKLFINQINDLFGPKYIKEIENNEGAASCKQQSKDEGLQLLTHQKIVRDYMNLYTPYRGLLLFHGLGSGKTCTSIAIAEGMKSKKRIFIMTPASLKMNFFSQLKKCGDELYRKNQFWEFISTEGKPDYIDTLSKILQIPADTVRKNKGAWLVNVKKPANFGDLDTREQLAIDEQLNLMIRAKYTDINYNGLNMDKMRLLTGDFSHNPFDNSVVMIDEAHNFVSRIVNKIPKTPKSGKAGKAKKAKGASEPLSYMLYDYLMSAKNARIVLMTGTPIINYPNEIGILFNILRGYIKTWTFPVRVKTEGTVNRDTILEMFAQEGFQTYDYVEYTGGKLTITRNPFGFVNTEKAPKGVGRGPKRGGSTKKHNPPKSEHLRKTKKRSNKIHLGKLLKNEVVKDYEIKNGMVVTTKVLDDLEILPEESEYEEHYKKGNTWDNEPHQGGAGSDIFDRYGGIQLDDTGNVPDDVFVATVIRILGKNGIEVVEGAIEVVNNKALPDDSETFMDKFIEIGADKMKNENVFKRRILGLTSYFRSAQESLLPNYILNEEGGMFHIVKSPMSIYQFGIYERIRKEEADKEKTAKKKKLLQKAKDSEDLYNVASTYRIFSRAACNFAFPDPPGRPLPDKGRGGKTGDVDESEYDAIPLEERVEADDYIAPDDIEALKGTGEDGAVVDYQTRITRAMKFLEYNPDKPREQEFLTREALETYSPKFLNVLDNLMDEENVGLHLVYSQFRTIEGIGILKLILEANGFAQFKIQKTSGQGAAGKETWEILTKPEDADKPRFVLYTGTETTEEKEIVRNIYNGDWENVPAEIVTELRKIGPNNLYGEIIKIFMITASGAEGINLRNTRFVHVVEPYWHMVRIEQVVGRARRICSHEELPEEERNIKVFLYLTTLPESLTSDKAEFAKHIELMNRDVSKLNAKNSVTTDELLFETATIKDNINRHILSAIKETAMDCALYASGNKSENLVCYGFGKVSSNQFASYPTLAQDETEKDELNVKAKKVVFGNVMIDKVKYAWNKETNELFDYESYLRAKKTGVDMVYLGRLVRDGPKKARIDADAPRA